MVMTDDRSSPDLQVFTINRLAGRDRRTIARHLRGIPPEGTDKGRPGWTVRTADAALAAARSRPTSSMEDKIRLAKSQADLAEYRLNRLKGELLPLEDVMAAGSGRSGDGSSDRRGAHGGSAAPSGRHDDGSGAMVLGECLDDAFRRIRETKVRIAGATS
jgi:hypothetical protein